MISDGNDQRLMKICGQYNKIMGDYMLRAYTNEQILFQLIHLKEDMNEHEIMITGINFAINHFKICGEDEEWIE